MTDIMQCKPYDPAKVVYPVFAQVKMDGIFGRWDSAKGAFFTRSGNMIRGLSVLEQECAGMPDLDGELVIPDMEFFKMNGLIRSGNETPSCMFYVFDTPLPYSSGAARFEYYQRAIKRHYQYVTCHDYMRESPNHVHPMKSHLCADERLLDKFYAKALSAGYEGIVLKSATAPYYEGKKWAVQKRVPNLTTECEVTGLIEGTKSFKGMLGAFQVLHAGETVRVGNGKGLDFALRQRVWDNKEEYVGQTMKVSYKSKTEKGSLRSPKFMGFRDIEWETGAKE